MTVPVSDKFQDSIQPALAAAVGELAFWTLHWTIPSIPGVVGTSEIHNLRIVARTVSDELKRRTIAVAIQDHPRSAVATIASIPIELSTHKIRRERNAIVAHPIAHPTLGMAISIAVWNFSSSTLGPGRPWDPTTQKQQNHAHRRKIRKWRTHGIVISSAMDHRRYLEGGIEVSQLGFGAWQLGVEVALVDKLPRTFIQICSAIVLQFENCVLLKNKTRAIKPLSIRTL